MTVSYSHTKSYPGVSYVLVLVHLNSTSCLAGLWFCYRSHPHHDAGPHPPQHRPVTPFRQFQCVIGGPPSAPPPPGPCTRHAYITQCRTRQYDEEFQRDPPVTHGPHKTEEAEPDHWVCTGLGTRHHRHKSSVSHADGIT